MAVGLSGRMFVSAAFSILYLYSSELFPTCVRNIAMGSLSFCARIGGILASFSKSMVRCAVLDSKVLSMNPALLYDGRA